MELMKNVASMQSAQVAQPEQSQSVQPTQSVTQEVEKIRNEVTDEAQSAPKVSSEKELKELVKDLNDSLGPFNTSIKFGFDNSSEDFYVSVLEADSNKLIRRFPAEQAFEILPKLQDVSGILFDLKG